MKIEKLNFSARTYNILKRANINDVEQLRQLSDDELLQIRNLGRHSFEEIKEKLECYTMTNADHIRSMSDEELCDFILGKRENGTCSNDRCYVNGPNKGCDDCTMEWLKQPHKEKE